MFNEVKWCPEWIIFTRGRRSPVSKSMAEIEAAEGQFVRLAGTAGGSLVLGMSYFVFFSLGILLHRKVFCCCCFLAGRVQMGFCELTD